jgi:hypothetical protein
VSVQKEKNELAVWKPSTDTAPSPPGSRRSSASTHASILVPQEEAPAPLQLVQADTPLDRVVQQTLAARPELKQGMRSRRLLVKREKDHIMGHSCRRSALRPFRRARWRTRRNRRHIRPAGRLRGRLELARRPGWIARLHSKSNGRSTLHLAELSVEKLQDDFVRQAVEALPTGSHAAPNSTSPGAP